MLAFVVAPVLFAGELVLVSSDLLGVGGPEPKPAEGDLILRGREGGRDRDHRLLAREEAPSARQCGLRLQRGGHQPPREPRLHVPSGARMEFVCGGPSAPGEIRVRAYRTDIPPNFDLAKEQSGPPANEGVHLGPLGFEEQRLAAEQTGERAGIAAELPPGEYQFFVSVRVDDETAEGEAHYDFDVAVE